MKQLTPVTGAEAGLSGDDQVRLALRAIADAGGAASTSDIYAAVESVLRPQGFTLSEQGKSSLRFFVNRVAVQAGYVHKHDPSQPGWRITAEGRDFLAQASPEQDTAVDVDTGAEERVQSNTAKGDAFEVYILTFLRKAYPGYAWYQQGRDKKRERGVDFVGNRIGDSAGEARSIGVQVKFHRSNNAPTEREWLKFLAGCFARRLDAAVFVTTGRLTGEQRREAQEARVVVVEGIDEVHRLTRERGLERFTLLDSTETDEMPVAG